MGRTAMGSINARPSCCSPANVQIHDGSPQVSTVCATNARTCGSRREIEAAHREFARSRSIRSERTLAFDRRYHGGHHRELAHSETQQYRHGQSIRGHAAADGDHLAGGGAGARSGRDEFEHRRMQGIGAAREFRMATIHGQSVLRQIVAADGQEIDFADETGRQERRGGSLDHRAQLDAAANPELRHELVDHMLRTARISDEVGHHGDRATAGCPPAALAAPRAAGLRNRSGRASAVRMPRKPSAGFSSAGSGR